MRDLAREFVAKGHRPTVIVPDSSLTSAWSLETLDDVEVLRLRAFRTRDIGFVRRALAEFSLPFAMLWGLSRSALNNECWDGVIWWSPNIFMGPLVRKLKRTCGCRAYLILRDIFPEWAADSGVMRRGVAYWLFKLVEHRQYASADIVGVQTPADLAYMRSWARKPNRRLEVLNNWLSETEAIRCASSRAQLKLAEKFVFVYAGNMGTAQGMDCMIRLAENLRDTPDVVFVFIGRGTEVPRLKALAAQKSLRNVSFHDEVEPWEIPGILERCQIGLLALDPRLKSHNIPGKFLTYLRAGLPVLARINAGNDLEEIIKNHNVGRVCSGNSDDQLLDLAKELMVSAEKRSGMGLRGKALANEMFLTANVAEQLLKGLRH
ncbi:MAG: glycosyltransferase family 4 protein [Chloroflexi bacterium]|nr:glycosyltransferase family 4 protein [Chloroflexota bacterium]